MRMKAIKMLVNRKATHRMMMIIFEMNEEKNKETI